MHELYEFVSEEMLNDNLSLQTMLAGVKLEVMVPSSETPDQGQIGRIMCSPLVHVVIDGHFELNI